MTRTDREAYLSAAVVQRSRRREAPVTYYGCARWGCDAVLQRSRRREAPVTANYDERWLDQQALQRSRRREAPVTLTGRETLSSRRGFNGAGAGRRR